MWYLMNEQLVPAGAQVIQPQPSVDYNIFIQELTTMTKKFDMFLMGQDEVIDENMNKQLIVTSKPKVNSRGRKAIMSWVNTYVNPNTYLAENKECNVQQNYKLECVNTAVEIYSNLNEWEMNLQDASAIHSRLCQIMFHALMRSMTDKKYIFPTINTVYQGQPQQQEKPKLWGLF
jgi:hypothetical protein